MRFAHWRKCDFQIHTPRDPNWNGLRPIGLGDNNPETGSPATEAEVHEARNTWAESFVNECVSRGLESIAVTDHHELVMVPYIQRAIDLYCEENSGTSIWLFPGMELTLHGGVQAIILFDPNLQSSWWIQAQGKLGIIHAAQEEMTAVSSKVTQLTTHYPDVADLLNEIPQLRGKFIVLPNVSQGGQHTVLTDGNHIDFKRMPYVGGYLDRGQTHETLSAKNKKRLSGTDVTWSERRIFPIPTTDSRSANFEHLGSNDTWIKLAEPCIESIRQAFLAYESRIATIRPEIPSLFLSGIEISASTILGDVNVNLSPELNSIIGGRGSGKSSFLEYLSFAVGKSCYDLKREDYSGSDRLTELVKESIIASSGGVEVTIYQDNAPFVISRSQLTGYQPQITYPNGESQPVSLGELRSLFPCVIYSQGELAEIGKKTGAKTKLSDLLQFVNEGYKKEDVRLIDEISNARDQVKEAIEALNSYWKLSAKRHQLRTKRDSLTQRVKGLEKTLPAQSEEDQAIIENYDMLSRFESKRLQASKHSDQIIRDIESLISENSTPRDTQSDLDAAGDFQSAYKSLFDNFNVNLSTLAKALKSDREELSNIEDAWKDRYEKARHGRDTVLEKLGEHKAVTGQIISLRSDIEKINNEIGDLDSHLSGIEDPSENLTRQIELLTHAVNNRAEKTKQWASEIQGLSKNKIKAAVAEYADISQIQESLDFFSSKTGSQEATRIKEFTSMLEGGDNIWGVLSRLRSDALRLLYWKELGSALGEEKPDISDLMKVIGDTEKIKTSLSEVIDVDRVIQISTSVPQPQISLFYCDGDKEISFEKASEGQRAAAMLFMLLEQGGGPLIVDQPEGDLDNKIISELTEILHSAKSKRQIIFASHNANIVVNGSSELVGYMGVGGEGNRIFEAVGAIDNFDVCKYITSTMEGGEKAFRDRKEKYGF